jgi:hypothetical protein
MNHAIRVAGIPKAPKPSKICQSSAKSPTRNSGGAETFPREPAHEEESEGELQPCERGFDCRLEVLGQAPGTVDPTQRSFHDPSFGQDDEPLDLRVGAFDDSDGNSACLIGGSLRLIALITAIDEGNSHPRALAMNRAEQGREGVSILNAGGGDLAFDRQAERIDGDMSFAALNFLAGVEAARSACFRRLDRLAIDNNGRWRGIAALSLARGEYKHTNYLRP